MPRIRKALSDWNAPYVLPIVMLAETQSKTTLAHWAIDYAERAILPMWIRTFPEDGRPLAALSAAREWLSGSVKLPQVKQVILSCHAAAREAEGNAAAQAAARAIGQAASTIHSARHSMGIVFYGALAVAYEQLGDHASWIEVERCAAEECGRMLYALRAVAVEREPNPARIRTR